MNKVPQNLVQTIIFLAQKLQKYQYAFRGTTGLVLQNLDMNVDDIDIIGDKKMALVCNKLFKDYLLDKVDWKESPKYKSYFGKFKVNGILVEVYGQWQIRDLKGVWSNVYNASEIQRKEVEFQGEKIRVTTIETELSMFAKMGRWTAFHKIKKQLSKPKNNYQTSILNVLESMPGEEKD